MAEEERIEDTRLGRYLLVHKLGHGGMGEVYRALAYGAAGVVKTVCIKRILAEKADKYWRVESFIEEARLSMQLSHTNIVSVFDFGVAEGGYYLAMEWIDGVDLMSFVRRRARLAPSIVAYIGSETCRGLARAHQGTEDGGAIIHRDVKPSNILLSRRGEVKLADFGIAVLQGGQSSVAGTPGYMSPEQEDGALVDGRADIYGLGVSLLEIAIGGRAKKIEEALEEVSDSALRIALGTMLEPDPALRAPTAEIVGKRFERMVATSLAAGGEHPRDLLAAEVAKIAKRAPQAERLTQELMGTASLVLAPSEMRRTTAPRISRMETEITGAPRVLPLTRALELREAASGEERTRGARPRWPIALFGLGFTLTLTLIFLYRGMDEAARSEREHAASAGALDEAERGDIRERGAAARDHYPAPLGPPIDVRQREVKQVPAEGSLGGAPIRSGALLLDPEEGDGGEAVEGGETRRRGITFGDNAEERIQEEAAPIAPPSPNRAKISARAPSTAMRQEAPATAALRASEAPRTSMRASETMPTGTLNISSRPWALVYVNGERRGETPIIGLVLPAGEHELRLENPELSVGRVVRVKITAGESVTYRADLQ